MSWTSRPSGDCPTWADVREAVTLGVLQYKPPGDPGSGVLPLDATLNRAAFETYITHLAFESSYPMDALVNKETMIAHADFEADPPVPTSFSGFQDFNRCPDIDVFLSWSNTDQYGTPRSVTKTIRYSLTGAAPWTSLTSLAGTGQTSIFHEDVPVDAIITYQIRFNDQDELNPDSWATTAVHTSECPL